MGLDLVASDRLAEAADRAVKQRPRGALPSPHLPRDLTMRQPANLVQQDDLPLIVGKVHQRLPQPLLVNLAIERARGALKFRRQHLILRLQRFAGAASKFIHGTVVRDPEEPGLKAIFLPQPGELAPGVEVRLRDGVLRTIWITDDGADVAAHVPEGLAKEIRKGVLAALLREPHKGWVYRPTFAT
jgi:hypothetical protein